MLNTAPRVAWFSGPIVFLLLIAALCSAEEVKRREPVAVNDLRFASASLHDYFHRFYTAAEKNGGHLHRPLAKNRFTGAVEAQWCTSVGANDLCDCEDRRLLVNRHVLLDLAIDKGNGVVKKLSGHAKCYPGGGGWGAAIHFAVLPHERKFGVIFTQKHEYGPRVALQQSGYRTSKLFDPFEYVIKVFPEPAIRLNEVELLAAIATPETLRDSMLKSLDQMHELVLVELASKKAIDVIYDHSVRPGLHEYSVTNYTDGFGEVRVRLPQQSHLEAIKQQIDADFDQRRNLVRKHYQELHTAVWKTFPLKECLGKRAMGN